MQKRIGLVGENSIAFVKHLLNIWNEGNTAVLLDWRIPLERIMELLAEAGATQCYIEMRFYDNHIQETSSIQFISFSNEQNKPELLPDTLYRTFQSNYSVDEALILFSSGTTGKSKGIILSHYAIQTNADYIFDYMKLDCNDRMMILKTLIHSSTLVGELLVCLKYGIAAYISPSTLLPKALLEWTSILNVTTLCLNPSLLVLLSRVAGIKKIDLTHLKKIYTSGSIATDVVLGAAEKTFSSAKIMNVYGLTEAGPRVTAQTESIRIKRGSVGKAIGRVLLAVKDSEGKDVMPGEIGTVYVKTPCCFKSYLFGDSGGVATDGWLNTGDNGYFDEDGDLFITGRADTMISIGSHNLYPEQVEEVIGAHTEVSECLVSSQGNNLNGSILVCQYVAQRDLSRELKELCMANLASYEIPSKFERVETISKTANGKKIRVNKRFS